METTNHLTGVLFYGTVILGWWIGRSDPPGGLHMEFRTSPGKTGSVQDISEYRAGGVCHSLSLCTLYAPVWPSRVDSGRDDRPFYLWRLVFSRELYPPPAFSCQH